MTSVVNVKTPEYANSPSDNILKEVIKPSPQTNIRREPQDLNAGASTAKKQSDQSFLQLVAGNLVEDQSKQTQNANLSGQFSLKTLNMDQLFKKDPTFNADKYREIFHIPNKKFLEIPGEKRSKLKDTKLFKDLTENEEISGILTPSPEKAQNDAVDTSEAKQDLVFLKNEVDLLKKKVDQMESESQRSSFKNIGNFESSDKPRLDQSYKNSEFIKDKPTPLLKENKSTTIGPTVAQPTTVQPQYIPYQPRAPSRNPKISSELSPSSKEYNIPNAPMQQQQQQSVGVSSPYNQPIYKSPLYTPKSLKSSAKNQTLLNSQKPLNSEITPSRPARSLATPLYENSQTGSQKENNKPQNLSPLQLTNQSYKPIMLEPNSYANPEGFRAALPTTQQYNKYQPRYNNSVASPAEIGSAYKPAIPKNIPTASTSPYKSYQPVSSKYINNNNPPTLSAETKSRPSKSFDKQLNSSALSPQYKQSLPAARDIMVNDYSNCSLSLNITSK